MNSSLFLNYGAAVVDVFGEPLDTSLCALATADDTPAHVADWLLSLASPATIPSNN